MNDGARFILERFLQAMNSHEAGAAIALLAENVRFWEPTYPEPKCGREAVRRDLEGFFSMLPDVHFTTEAILADGNRAAHEWTYRATFDGRPIEVRECAVSRLDENGCVAEVRVYFDRLSLLRQLGLAPTL